MKKPFVLLIIILAAGLLWYLVHKTTNTPIPTTSTSTGQTNTAIVHPDPKNGTFQFEDAAITLKNGTNQTPVPNSAMVEQTELADTIGYGDLNNDSKEDAGVVLIQSGGGTGIFFYVAGFISSPTGYKGTSALFLGDRISPKSIVIKNGVMTVTYLDRKETDPFSTEPTIQTIKTFKISSGDLVDTSIN